MSFCVIYSVVLEIIVYKIPPGGKGVYKQLTVKTNDRPTTIYAGERTGAEASGVGVLRYILLAKY